MADYLVHFEGRGKSRAFMPLLLLGLTAAPLAAKVHFIGQIFQFYGPTIFTPVRASSRTHGSMQNRPEDSLYPGSFLFPSHSDGDDDTGKTGGRAIVYHRTVQIAPKLLLLLLFYVDFGGYGWALNSPVGRSLSSLGKEGHRCWLGSMLLLLLQICNDPKAAAGVLRRMEYDIAEWLGFFGALKESAFERVCGKWFEGGSEGRFMIH